LTAGESPVEREGCHREPEASPEECGDDVTCLEQVQDALERSRDELREAEARAEEYLQQLQRVQAEFQNYKRRVERERERSRRQSLSEAIRKWLPVIDNLERVMTSTDDDEDPVRQGVEMILRQVDGVLTDMGVERIPTVGEVFDPRVHEAVEHIPTDERPEGEITGEYQAGYSLGDVLIRPARVQVARGPSGEDEVGDEAACEDNCED